MRRVDADRVMCFLLGMRGIWKKTAVLKVTVLYTANLLNTTIYRRAALTVSTLDDRTKHRGIPVSRSGVFKGGDTGLCPPPSRCRKKMCPSCY